MRQNCDWLSLPSAALTALLARLAMALDSFQGRRTPPKTNIEPENDGLEDNFPFQMGDL